MTIIGEKANNSVFKKVMNTMPAKEDILSIHRYLSGEMSDSEKVGFDARLQNDPSLDRLFAELSAVWQAASAYQAPDFPHQTAYAAFRDTVITSQVRRRRRMIGIGLVALIAILLSIWYLSVQWSPAEMQEINTGVAMMHVLDDGTRIHIRGESHLRVPVKTGKKRTVDILSGEAFFEVVHDPARSFTVRNSMGDVVVTGTAFVVAVDTGVAVLTVSVTEGSVRFMPAESSLQIPLAAGQGMRYDAVQRVAEPTTGPGPNTLSWQTGVLVFDDAPLRIVLRDLLAHYGIEVTISDTAMLHCRFTAPLPYQDVPVSVIVDALATTFAFKAERSASGQYVLKGGVCR